MDLQQVTDTTLARLRRQGFDAAQVEASTEALAELNVAHDTPALMRSTERHRLALLGLLDGRRASTEIGDFSPGAVDQAVADLFAAARTAPQDAANAVSSGQQAQIRQGPLQAESAAMADTMAALLAWRAAHTPQAMLEEAAVSHHRRTAHLATSAGSSLASDIGWYALDSMATAREGDRSSSFNFAGGTCHGLDDGTPAEQRFGVGAMLADLTRQVHTRPLAGRFTGEVVLAPPAVDDLLRWLLGQLQDLALIAGTSLYRQRVGELIASPLLSLHSRFDAPGVAALSADGFNTPPLTVLQQGRLMALTPSLYASRQTGVPHTPVAPGGWAMAAGSTPLAEMLAAVPRGALVGRLSMGMPASNGNFSGVIKNSFLIEQGQTGAALAEVMVSGNMAQMLQAVLAVSRERLDTGATLLPWLRIGGLHFS